MSKIKVDQLEGSTGSTITVPTGQTLTITDGLAASTISSGTLADADYQLPVSKGGTGITLTWISEQVLRSKFWCNCFRICRCCWCSSSN